MFSITYEIITPESAEHGDAEERGFIAENCALREAVDHLFETRTAHCSGIHAIEGGEWITVYNGTEHLTGAYENRSLHFPPNITDARRRHIAKLLGAELI